MSRGPAWNERDLELALDLHGAGLTYREIGMRIARSKEAVEARVQKYNRENRFGYAEADIRAASDRFGASLVRASA